MLVALAEVSALAVLGLISPACGCAWITHQRETRPSRSFLRPVSSSTALSGLNPDGGDLPHRGHDYTRDVDDGERTWSATPRRSGGHGRATEEYRFRGTGMEDLNEDDLRSVRRMLARRTEAKRARDYDTADAIRDDLFHRFSVRVDDKKRNWYFDWSAGRSRSRPKTATTAKSQSGLAKIDRDDSPWNGDDLKSIPWANDDEDNFDPNSFDEILDVSLSSQLPELYQRAPTSLNVRKEEEDYIVKRIITRIEAATDKDFDTVSAIQTELLLCYDVHLDDELGLWSKGGNFGMNTGDQSNDPTDPGSSTLEGENEERLKALTVPVLKEKLREMGLPVSGKKAELIERLLSST